MYLRPTVAAACVLLAASCSSPGGPTPTDGRTAALTSGWPSLGVPDNVTPCEFAWRASSSAEIATSVSLLHDILRGTRLNEPALRPQVETGLASRAPFVVGADVSATVEQAYDTVSVYDSRLLQDEWGDNGDIGRDAARERAGGVLQALHDRGLIDAASYDLAQARTSTRGAGRGTREMSVAEYRAVEYRFTLMPHVNGYPLAAAGVGIGIHRSGAVSSIRLGGATVAGASGADTPIPVRVSLGELRERALTATLPHGARPHLEFEMIAYVPRRAAGRSTVEPNYVLGYSPVVDADDGSIAGRPVVIAVSLTDPSLAGQLLSPEPNPDATGDER